jgi:nucleoside-diphosphate-sugar epimerase
VRAFVTGGTGFIGGHLIRILRERGDDVVALVRSPAKAEALLSLGCEIVPIRMSIPLAPLVTRLMGLPPNLRELIKAADGVTYWATDAKARRELGYAPRDLETGLRQTLAL